MTQYAQITDAQIITETRGGVAVVTMNRPQVMNALSSSLRREMLAAVREAQASARVLVITGLGRAFCSGQDLNDASGQAGPLEALDFERILSDEYEPLLTALAESPIPTIAAVNGAAAGAGANLALACDVVIATESAVFLQAFTRIGLMPDAGGTWWLPRQVGLARAMGAALFAEPVSARQAVDWGMIWEAVPDEDFVAHWQRRAEQLANGPTTAYRGVKQAMRSSFGNDLGAQLALEARLQGQCGRTRDFAEGVGAFLGKRKPQFVGS